MANTIPEWVKEGAEVVELPPDFGRVWGRVLKIGKVRKNGLFTLEGDDGLYSAGPIGASPCKGNYGARHIKPYTNEAKEEAEKSWKVAAARDRLRLHMEKLNRAITYWDADVILAEAAKLPPEEGP